MPTIWLCGGFGWPAALPRSRFEVRRSTFSFRPRWAQSSPRRVSGETPVSGRGNCDETRIAPIGRKGSGPALAGRQSQASCKSVASVSGGGPMAVRCGSGGGPMWVAQGPDSTPLTTLVFWLWASLSAPRVDGAGATPASPPCGSRKPLALNDLWAYHWQQVRRTLHFH